MNHVKFTGVNIAAALLILAYFFPWVSLGVMGISWSGISMTGNGVSPGIYTSFLSGLSRFLMALAILVPLSGALILYQNISGNNKFDKFYKPAHIIPFAYLALGIIILYFKMKPEAPTVSNSPYGEMMNDISRSVRDMTPGAFDIITFGVYISLIASIYLLLVSMGKVKDKEYYKPGVAAADNKPVITPAENKPLITSTDKPVITPDKPDVTGTDNNPLPNNPA